jgi:hypothetical protein
MPGWHDAGRAPGNPVLFQNNIIGLLLMLSDSNKMNKKFMEGQRWT